MAAFLASRGLQLSEHKTVALIVHPEGNMARRSTPLIRLHGRHLPSRLTVKYLGLLIESRLQWLPAVKAPRGRTTSMQGGVRESLARGNGCTYAVAQKVSNGMASSALLYALSGVAPLVEGV